MKLGSLASVNKYFLRYKWRIIIGVIFVCGANYFQILQPQVIRDALNMVVEYLENSPMSPEDKEELRIALLKFGGLVLGYALMMGIFMFMMRQTIIVMSRLIEYDMRKDIYDHYSRLDLGFYRKNKTGDLMARISEDVSKVRMYVGPSLLYAVNIAFLFTFVIYSMYSVDAKLATYCLLPLPVLSVSIYFLSNVINKRSTLIQKQLSSLNSAAQEVYSGIRIVKSYVQEPRVVESFTEESESFKEKSMGLARANALFGPLMLLIIGTSTILTIYFGGRQVIAGELQAGNIAEFVIYVNMLTWPVTSIGWIASLIQQAAVSMRRINEFMDTEPAIKDEGHIEAPIQGHVHFDNVSFVYPDTGIKALDGVSFDIKPGERVAIVGRTGSGKTTVADLLLRMFDTKDGQISIDNQPIEKHKLSYLRERIGYVTQDVFLFSDTIAQNVSFGMEDHNQKAVEDMTKYASVYDDIIDFPNGFETPVGERGVTLSGGQKQRLSIARALLKDPDIIILDDCLSAVDTTTEQAILNYLNTALKGKTAIIITHRIYESMDFDKIIVLENGKVKEMGNHQELIELNGYYAKLLERQRQFAQTSSPN